MSAEKVYIYIVTFSSIAINFQSNETCLMTRESCTVFYSLIYNEIYSQSQLLSHTHALKYRISATIN